MDSVGESYIQTMTPIILFVRARSVLFSVTTQFSGRLSLSNGKTLFLCDHFSNPSKNQEPVDPHHSYMIGIVSESTSLNLLTSHIGLGNSIDKKEGPMLP